MVWCFGILTRPANPGGYMKKLAKLIVLSLFGAFILSTAFAQCEHGTLDARFCDTDGDLIADAPTNPDEWLDPDTIIFSYTPVEDPALYADVWADFLVHMESVTGKKVKFFPVDSNAAQLEAMRAGRLHVSGFNTGSVPFAVNVAGFHPFAMMASEDGNYGYHMVIITPPGSDITDPSQIAGRTMAHTSETSNSGHKAPTALLKADFNLTIDEDYDVVYSGKHDNSILGVANGDYEVASIADSVLRRMIERGVVSADDVNIIYESQAFPTTAFGYAYNLKPELADKIQEAFFSYEWDGTPLQEEFARSGESQFIPIDYKTYWEVIRKIDQANGVVYVSN